MFLCYDTKLSFWGGSLTFLLGGWPTGLMFYISRANHISWAPSCAVLPVYLNLLYWALALFPLHLRDLPTALIKTVGGLGLGTGLGWAGLGWAALSETSCLASYGFVHVSYVMELELELRKTGANGLCL
jgi:hypothetical protein